MDTAHF